MDREPSELERAVVAQIAYEKEQNGITSAELARRAGMSAKSLKRKMSFERDFLFGEIEALAKALRMDGITLIAEAAQRFEEKPGVNA